jgi:DNA-binding NarL/FixJ family response regulator
VARAAGPPGHREPLTGLELQVAELAAAGLSNKQIGARLYMSHRTVGAHLYRIFPKLGVSTRAALRDALSRQAAA